MKINSIQVKVASLIILILTVSITSVLIFTNGKQKSELIKSTQRTLTVNTAILNTVIRNLMLSGEAPIATNTVRDLKTLPSLTEVSIYRIDGTTAFSDYETLTKVNEFQDMVIFEETDRIENIMADNQNFKEVLKTRTPKENELVQSQELEYYFPILNYKECRACHGDEEFIRGVVHFKISLAGVYQTISDSRRLTTILFIGIGLIITFLLYLSLKRVVLKPIKSISNVVNQVGLGNLDRRVVINNNDELGTLGNYINQMIVGLKERNTLLVKNRVIEAQNNENKKYLDNIQEGLLLLDKNFKITGLYSDFFKKLFKIENPEGISIQDVIYPESESEEFMDFLDMVMNSLHADMEMLLEINPVNNIQVKLSDETTIIIDAYFARVFNSENEVENIMVIFKDRTKIAKIEKDLVDEKRRSQSELEIISSMLKSGTEDFKTLLKDLSSISISIDTLYKENPSMDKTVILRDLHTLKGVANYLGFNQLADIIHNSETLLGNGNNESIKESFTELNDELNIMEEIYNKFQDFIGSDLKISPLDKFLKILPSMVKETSEKLDKSITFNIESKLDDFPYLPQIKGSIIHLLKNSIDHGIEDTFKRLERKKLEDGVISLKLYKDRKFYIIEISDDGNGLDFNLLQKRALEKGITTKKNLSHSELTKLMFTPNFSSKDDVTEISGRGFGLDAVKASVDELNGFVYIKNRTNKGTTFELKLPLGEN